MIFKKLLKLMLAGVNTSIALISACTIAHAHALTRATILGTSVCHKIKYQNFVLKIKTNNVI